MANNGKCNGNGFFDTHRNFFLRENRGLYHADVMPMVTRIYLKHLNHCNVDTELSELREYCQKMGRKLLE